MPADPIISLISKTIESKAIHFANYANTIQSQIDDVLESLPDGVDIQQIIRETKLVSGVVDSYFSDVEKTIKGIVHQLAQTGWDDVVLKDAKETDLFEWVTAGNRHCPDCADRAGRQEKYSVWCKIGRPEDHVTLCGDYCHCTLTPV